MFTCEISSDNSTLFVRNFSILLDMTLTIQGQRIGVSLNTINTSIAQLNKSIGSSSSCRPPRRVHPWRLATTRGDSSFGQLKTSASLRTRRRLKPGKYTRSWALPWENMVKTLVFLRKTLEDTVEDVDTSREFPWKTQIE